MAGFQSAAETDKTYPSTLPARQLLINIFISCLFMQKCVWTSVKFVLVCDLKKQLKKFRKTCRNNWTLSQFHSSFVVQIQLFAEDQVTGD